MGKSLPLFVENKFQVGSEVFSLNKGQGFRWLIAWIAGYCNWGPCHILFLLLPLDFVNKFVNKFLSTTFCQQVFSTVCKQIVNSSYLPLNLLVLKHWDRGCFWTTLGGGEEINPVMTFRDYRRLMNALYSLEFTEVKSLESSSYILTSTVFGILNQYYCKYYCYTVP